MMEMEANTTICLPAGGATNSGTAPTTSGPGSASDTTQHNDSDRHFHQKPDHILDENNGSIVFLSDDCNAYSQTETPVEGNNTGSDQVKTYDSTCQPTIASDKEENGNQSLDEVTCRTSEQAHNNHPNFVINISSTTPNESSSPVEIGLSNQTTHSDNSKSDSIYFGEEESVIRNVFDSFDENSDGVLDGVEFFTFLQSIYQDQNLTDVAEEKRVAFMKYIDSNDDGVVDFGEFKHAWFHCFKKILQPVTALIVVDVQHDFIDGSLALRHCPAKQEGAEVVPIINELLEECKFDMVAYTMDWHPQHHISFVDNVERYPIHHSCTAHKSSPSDWCTYEEIKYDLSPPRAQILWPAHCIQGTNGAELHKDLTIVPGAVNIYKGTKLDIDSYSAFFDNMRLSHTAMQDELNRRNVTDVFICGLAYDVCVAATSKDAVDLGYRTVVVDDACRGVSDDDVAQCKNTLNQVGAVILHSDDVKKLAHGQTKSFDLGLFAAKTMPAASAVVL